MRFYEVIRNLPYGVLIVDQKGEIVFVNQSTLDLFEYSREEMMGQSVSMVVPSRIRASHGKNIEKFFTSPKTRMMSKGLDLLGEKKNGMVLPLEIDLSFFTTAREMYGVAYIKDVTERKAYEEEQKKNLILQKSKDFAEQFLASMSHEIRTPLNGIIGMLDVLNHEDLNDSVRKKVDVISSSSENLLRIINDILDYSKLKAGEFKILKKPVDLYASMEATIDLFRDKASHKGINLDVQIDESIDKYHLCDFPRVAQIISNFVNNAIKFSENGSINILVRKSYKNTDHLWIGVQDEGIGIAKEDLGKLFSKFAQLQASGEKMYEGTGLGLEISRKLVEMFGGDIGVDSEKGKGSLFWFSLPYTSITKEEFEKTIKAPVKSDSLSKSYHALVVDDNKINRTVAQMNLKVLNCTAENAENGLESIGAFTKNEDNIDIILMDINMPKMNGVDVLNALREKHNNLPPIVALTASVMKGDKEKYLRKGFDGYISKPITLDKLKKEMIRLLE